MAVLEITLLRIKPASTTTIPTNTTNNPLAALHNARTALATRVYNTHSRFFLAVADPSLVYIFGMWPSVERHLAFLGMGGDGDEEERERVRGVREEILGGQEDVFEFLWGKHVVLNEGEGGKDSDGEGAGVEDVMEQFVPINAPVLCLGRFEMLSTTPTSNGNGDGAIAKEKFTSIWTKYSPLVVEATEPFPLCAAWSVEGGDGDVFHGSTESESSEKVERKGEREKSDEWIVISGWKDKVAHEAFRTGSKVRFPELLGLRELYRREEVRLLVDMEG